MMVGLLLFEQDQYLFDIFKVIKGFESDEDQLEYLASLMSDGEDDGTQLKTPGDEQKKSRTESKAFDKELDEITKSRKRKLSSESGKRVNKKKKEQVNDKTASLQGRLVALADQLTVSMLF